jgi:hypothetical protein
VQVLDADRLQSVRRVVIAAHAELGQLDVGEPLGPGRLEVAQHQDQIGAEGLDQLTDRAVRRRVGERER